MKHLFRSGPKTIGLAIFLSLLMAAPAMAGQVKLQWNANDPAPTGYRVYQRTGAAYDYTKPVYDGQDTGCTLTVPDGAQMAFVVRAYVKGAIDGTIKESADSNEAVYFSPVPSPKNLLIQAIDQMIQGLQTLKRVVAGG